MEYLNYWGISLKKEDFRRWLHEQGPDSFVGIRLDQWACPIAAWTNLTVSTTVIGDDDEQVDIPVWMALFVADVDSGKTPVVTAGECLEILDDIED